MRNIPIPESFGYSKKSIVRAFFAVRKRETISGSELHRRIARRLGRGVDRNGDNSFIRLTLAEYMEFLSRRPR